MVTAVASPLVVSPRRAVLLILLFGVVASLLLAISPQAEAVPRWPGADDLYAVDGWRVSSPQVDSSRPGLAMVTRTFTRADGARATLVISTSPMAKAVYRAGAAVPFLGNGYTVEPAAVSGNFEAITARRGNDAWLQISAYGERRGQFGSGAVAWGLSVFDSVFAQPNDYYLARIVAPADSATAQVVELATTLLPRLATFYAS